MPNGNQEILLEHARRFASQRDLKKELEDQLQGIKDDMEKTEAAMVTEMLDLDMPKFVHDGYSYSLSSKTYYNMPAADREQGFEMLRGLGLGFLIQERLDDRSLTNQLNAVAEENDGELPQEYAALPLTTYDKNKISMRKESGKNARKAG